MLAFTILIFYTYAPIVAHYTSGAEVQTFDEGTSLEFIRQELEHTLGRATNWVYGTDETQKLQSGDSILVTIQPELVLMTGSEDGTAKITSFRGENTETIRLPEPVSDIKVAFSADAETFAISYASGPSSNRIHEFKLFSDRHKRCRTFSTPLRNQGEDFLSLISFSADGKWVSNTVWEQVNEKRATMYRVGDEENPLVLRGAFLEFSPDNEKFAYVSASADREVHIGQPSTQTSTQIEPPTTTDGHISWVCFSPDGKLLAINYATEVRIIDVESSEVVHVIKWCVRQDDEFGEDTEYLVSALFSPNGKHIVIFEVVGDIMDMTFMFEEDEGFDDLKAIAFDPTGQYLALAKGTGVSILDTSSWEWNEYVKGVKEFRYIHEDDVSDVVFGYRNAWAQASLSIQKHV